VTALAIDVFSDIVCPWCFIGTRRLDQAVGSLQEPADVTIRHRPFMLIPSTPAEGVDVLARLRERYGPIEPGRLFAPAEAAARESGIPLNLMKQPRAYSTVAAQTLLRHADERGVGPAVAAALYEAHFLEAKNVSLAEVLVEIAARHGFDRADAACLVRDEVELAITRREMAEATASGIRGVPHFVIGGRITLSGAQPLEVFRDALHDAIAGSRSGSEATRA
jgi:predicted DsbA family dithiol-disulfide isomerase